MKESDEQMRRCNRSVFQCRGVEERQIFKIQGGEREWKRLTDWSKKERARERGKGKERGGGRREGRGCFS